MAESTNAASHMRTANGTRRHTTDVEVEQRSTKEKPVTWMSLPQKSQLAVLTLARLSEPLAERSMAAYMFFQLRWFDPDLPESTIASQGGMVVATFAAAQFLTAVWWGRAADTPWIGRKKVLLVGLFGTFISSIGIGFSKSFAQALFFRAMAGALNGNVGVMRTMISEIIEEKKPQSRAFLLLPMCFNIGVVIGPMLGGFLADPISSFPKVFGPNSSLGGKTGIGWMLAYPYALPSLVSGFFILIGAFAVVLGLDETHQALRNKPDYGRKVGRYLANMIRRRPRQTYQYTQLDDNEDVAENTAIDLEEHPQNSTTMTSTTTSSTDDPYSASSETTSHPAKSLPRPQMTTPQQKSPFRSILTRNVVLTSLSHHLLALHISTFNALIFLFLPYPTYPTLLDGSNPFPTNDSTTTTPTQDQPPPPPPNLPFLFTGGLGLTPQKLGLATSIIGLIGFPLQLLLYPTLHTRLGTLRSYRLFLPFSILAYTLMPYLALLPVYLAPSSSSPSSTSATYNAILWPTLTLILTLQVLSRTFALPSQVILVNNAAPRREVLGTVHGVAQSVSSAGRTLGPVVGGWILSLGLKGNCVGGVWWGMAVVAVVNWALLWFVWEGDGEGRRL